MEERTATKLNSLKMDIALIGYGKMGKAIEKVAEERGHQIVLKINRENQSAFSEAHLRMADVAIEFTSPEAALNNILKCLDVGIPIVCGTTGWNKGLPQVNERCLEEEGSFLYASNFSIGVNLFFEINKYVATLMNERSEYDLSISETHHLEKKDIPSGTAITLAEQALELLKNKRQWQSVSEIKDSNLTSDILPILSFRENGVPGTHKVSYSSEIDDIEIIHTAHSRIGFALGAVLAAEFIKNRKGVFTMQDVLFGKK